MKQGKRGSPGVKLVRGPFVSLERHPDGCEDEAALRALVRRLRKEQPDRLLAADLFSGAGGLSLGLEAAGMSVVFASDFDKASTATHQHHFGGLCVDWDLSDSETVTRVGELLGRLEIDVVAGGPPCQPFSKAGRSIIRHQVRQGRREAHDHRRDLWLSFLDVVRLSQPRAVIMENVPDMALDREMFILRTMVLELEQMGYSVEERVLDTWRYGVPQFRQRLILVALRDRLHFAWPQETPRKTTVENAIGDLPPVEGGWRPEGGADGWTEYPGPKTDFQRQMRRGVSKDDERKLFDHITRPVRPDDAEAFALMDVNTRYSELPDEYKRYRDDIFDDKYKRLDPNDLSRTITAHIAKDGYWYIHPYQGRTLTVREAARLQTFPDWFRFSGPPSHAFKQIGNAVPPRLGEVLGDAVIQALDRKEPEPYSSEEISTVLARWLPSRSARALPWIEAETRWQVVSAQILLDRAPSEVVRHIWPLVRRWRTPADTDAATSELKQIGSWLERESRVSRLLGALEGTGRAAADLTDAQLSDLVASKHITQPEADVALLVVAHGDASEEPVIASRGTLRPVARILGDAVDRKNRLTDGRMAVSRLIGFGEQSRRAQLALMEIAASVCRPADPRCTECPAADFCVESRRETQLAGMLPGALDVVEAE